MCKINSHVAVLAKSTGCVYSCTPCSDQDVKYPHSVTRQMYVSWWTVRQQLNKSHQWLCLTPSAWVTCWSKSLPGHCLVTQANICSTHTSMAFATKGEIDASRKTDESADTGQTISEDTLKHDPNATACYISVWLWRPKQRQSITCMLGVVVIALCVP